MVRDTQSRVHVQRVEEYIDFICLLDDWKVRLNRDLDVIRAQAMRLSPEYERSA
ncbi:MAG: hypothetical protein AB7R89_28235 [Dehalococcoidia bacterium]